MACSFSKPAHYTNLVSVSLGLALLLILGCSTTPSGEVAALQFEATGDAGVEFKLVVRRNGKTIQEEMHTVPVHISLEGRNLDVVCVHGKKPGNLDVRVTRDGLSVSVSSTSELGAVSEFKVRSDEISTTTRTARAAEANATQ